jgi:hypothetical protein
MQLWVYPNVAKVGGLQSQDAKGAAVPPWRDCKSLAIPPQAGESSGFPPNLIKWGEKVAYNRFNPQVHLWFFLVSRPISVQLHGY